MIQTRMTRMKRIAKRKKKMVTRMRRSILLGRRVRMWRLSIRATAKERRRKGQEREEGERQD
jgi:hypothetical protein